MKLPAFQFYPGDWRKDPNLCRCSHAAKGVWIDMICLMHETEERGVLSTNGIPWTEDDIVLAVGGDSSVTRAAIQELTLKGVVNRGDRLRCIGNGQVPAVVSKANQAEEIKANGLR